MKGPLVAGEALVDAVPPHPSPLSDGERETTPSALARIPGSWIQVGATSCVSLPEREGYGMKGLPRNTDGEVDSFYLWPIERVMREVLDGGSFKLNCALVVIDFLIRHGYIRPEEPDYRRLVAGLRPSDTGRIGS